MELCAEKKIKNGSLLPSSFVLPCLFEFVCLVVLYPMCSSLSSCIAFFQKNKIKIRALGSIYVALTVLGIWKVRPFGRCRCHSGQGRLLPRNKLVYNLSSDEVMQQHAVATFSLFDLFLFFSVAGRLRLQCSCATPPQLGYCAPCISCSRTFLIYKKFFWCSSRACITIVC